MKLRTFLFIFLLSLLAVGIGVARYYILPEYFAQIQEKAARAVQPTPSASATVSAQLDPKVEQAFATLTEEQKIAQVFAFPLIITNERPIASESAAWISERNPGFVTLFGKNVSSVSAKAAITQVRNSSKNQVLPFFAVDHEGGGVQRFNGPGFTQLPSWKQLCSQEKNLVQTQLTQSAQELAQVGVQVVFGPVVDKGESAVLGERICSADLSLLLRNSRDWVEIFHFQGITSVIKHYPGIGNSQQDLHVKSDIQEIDKTQLEVFNTLLAEYPFVSVMSTHVTVPLEGKLRPCSLSANCLSLVRVNSDQVIFSDALEMVAAQGKVATDQSTDKPLEEISIEALEAGNTVLVFGTKITPVQMEKIFSRVQQKYQSDPAFKQKIDQNVKRILKFKL